MTSPLSTDNVETSQQNVKRLAISQKITPAIPLSYLRKSQQFQSERTKAFRKADETAQVANRDADEQDNQGKSKSLLQSAVILTESMRSNDPAGIDKPTSITVTASRLEKAENFEEQTHSRESSHKSITGRSALNGFARANAGEIILSGQESNQADNLSPESVLAKQSQNGNVKFESVRFPQQQSFGSYNTPFNKKTMVQDNSESSKSSPAPTQSAAHPPPSLVYEQSLPGNYLTHQYNSCYSQHLSNVYSSVGQLQPNGYYVCMNGYPDSTNVDQFSVGQTLSVRPLQDISPTLHQFEARHTCEPTTPHSFQGSQSSALDRDASKHFDNQNSPVINTTIRNGNLDYTQNYQKNSLMNTNRDQYLPPLPILQNHVSQLDMFDGLIEYLSSQFANPTFADYTLEFRYSDDRAAPVRIPGHNLIFARSITLRHMMLAARNETDGATSKTLLIESDDRFISTDGLYMAMHRLYGNSLLDLGAIIPIGPTGQYQLPLISTSTERFNLAIGYAAAGHLLKMDVVVNRGCEIASLALNWINLERGLDFALHGGLEPQWRIHSWDSDSPRATYGPGVNMIIVKAVGFISCNFPAHFQLDISVSQERFALRLPKVLDQQQPSSNPQISRIKFGDHVAEEFQPLGTQQTPTTILSRVLIGLPWELLRYTFESSHLANNIESLFLRHQILSSVVREREKRRLKVYNSSVPNSERQKKSQEWTIVGWKEEVEALHGDEIHPKLNRTWVDYKIPES